jgi:hypothetical protein
MSKEINTLYKELFDAVNRNYQYNKQKVGIKDLSCFVAMKGENFDSSDVQLFVIGRATNGWQNTSCDTAQIFADGAERRFTSKGFSWIKNTSADFNELCNIPQEGQKAYYLYRSPFWRVAYEIWYELSGKRSDLSFLKSIAWSNLYKIAPAENIIVSAKSGNPTVRMCTSQFEACKKILDYEIRSYKPTHILIVTGYDQWYAPKSHDFSEIFRNNKETNQNKYVEGTARYEIDGKSIPVVITCRPEGRKENDFTKEVLNTFNVLKN